MNLRIAVLAAALTLVAGAVEAQTRVNPNRSADQLNARVLEVLQAREVAPLPTPPAPAPAPVLTLTGVYVGGVMGTNFQDTTDYTLGAVLGYQFHRNFAAEVTYDYMRVGGLNRVNDGQMVMGNLVASQRLGATSITPYVLGGAGMGWNHMGERGTGDNLALYNVGGGARVGLVSNIELDVRYRYVGAFNHTADGNHHMMSGGVSIRF